VTSSGGEALRTVVHHRPDGIVVALHGFLSRMTAPGVDSLLACLRDTERGATIVDLRDAELEPGVAELVARRWGLAP
jgi:hypothetical protein